MAFASAMIASVGQEALNINAEKTQSDSEVANIVFVCEYLLGMPVVSAIVVHADVTQNKLAISAGPCFKTTSVSTTWQLHKDTYLFVTPTFIRKYAGDLESVETDPDFTCLTTLLQSCRCEIGADSKEGVRSPLAFQLALHPINWILWAYFLFAITSLTHRTTYSCQSSAE